MVNMHLAIFDQKRVFIVWYDFHRLTRRIADIHPLPWLRCFRRLRWMKPKLKLIRVISKWMFIDHQGQEDKMFRKMQRLFGSPTFPQELLSPVKMSVRKLRIASLRCEF